MKKNITYFLLAALSIIILPLLFAQPDQSTPKSNTEVEALKERISKLESKLQTVENVEKMELTAKLAEAQAKLRNAEIDKFRRELRDANDEWLRTWSLWFVGIIGFLVLIVGGAFWFWLRSRTDQLIADSVEKSLTGFKEAVGQVHTLKNELKEAVGQVNILENQLEVLEKEHAASVLEGIIGSYPYNRGYSNNKPSYAAYPERIKVLQEDVLLQVFGDKRYNPVLRRKAIEVLAAKRSPRLVSPVLEFLNSVIDSDLDIDYLEIQACLHDYIDFLADMETPEAHQGLKKLCDRLLTENLRYKGFFLNWTVLPLGRISFKLKMKDTVSMLRKAIPGLKVSPRDHEDVIILVKYFDTFNEPEGIKEILTNGLTDRMPEVETQCLELLEQKYDPEFVEKWKAEKATTNPETEESE